jgi:hypothetical protein
MEVKGELSLQITDPSKAQIRIALKPIEAADLQTKAKSIMNQSLLPFSNRVV